MSEDISIRPPVSDATRRALETVGDHLIPEAHQGAITSGEYMAGEGRRMFGDTVPSGLPDRFAMTVREPVGVVGIITPWNLPMLMPAWKLFPALVCGNTVVVKPAEDTPFTAVRAIRDPRRSRRAPGGRQPGHRLRP